jgi:protein-S-isoprenylcysteine O-methyltransferase Ste14
MRWRVRAGYPVAVIYWVLARPTPGSISIGGLIALMGLFIRGAASGHLHKDQQLATSGPYAHSRNPLYFGSAFLAAGFAVAGHSWPAGVLVVTYFGIFYYAVIRNEEEALGKRFGSAFEAYAARVPVFFPRLARSAQSPPGGSPAFSWAQYRRNREHHALIGTLTGLALMTLRMWIRSRFGY